MILKRYQTNSKSISEVMRDLSLNGDVILTVMETDIPDL